jgi:CRISPR/Cas system CMR-associated protein Cmr5 small subunit
VYKDIANEDAQQKADRALQVVKELHKRYQQQEERWRNYSKLFGFICFAALLLTVLYLQRNAQLLYQVHSTIAAGVLPEAGSISSPKDVLLWLKNFLKVRRFRGRIVQHTTT